MKKMIKKSFVFGITLCYIMACTGCKTVDSGTNLAGADNLSKENILIDYESVEAENEAESLDITKDQLYYKCMNSLEYLDHVSADLVIRYGANDPFILKGKVNHDFKNGLYYTNSKSFKIETPDEVFWDLSVYNNSIECHSLHNNIAEGSKRHDIAKGSICPSLNGRTFANACPLNPDSDESKNDKSGKLILSIDDLTEEQLLATYGCDPTGGHEMGAFYIPQEMSYGYLQNFDNWEITESKEYQGRICAFVEGTASPDYGDKFNVKTFKIIIDEETGAWMQFEGFSENGDIMQYVYTENVLFGEKAADVPVYNEKYADGYEENDLNAAYNMR